MQAPARLWAGCGLGLGDAGMRLDWALASCLGAMWLGLCVVVAVCCYVIALLCIGDASRCAGRGAVRGLLRAACGMPMGCTGSSDRTSTGKAAAVLLVWWLLDLVRLLCSGCGGLCLRWCGCVRLRPSACAPLRITRWLPRVAGPSCLPLKRVIRAAIARCSTVPYRGLSED